jgi:DNA topoisomerase I
LEPLRKSPDFAIFTTRTAIGGTIGDTGALRFIMVDRQNFIVSDEIVPAEAIEPIAKPRPPASDKLAHRLGLKMTGPAGLTLRRQKRGTGWSYLHPDGRAIRDAKIVKRLASMAMPPAYLDVRYAADPKAHLQATGRDAAGRLQYRYHADWEKVRETRKARRLGHLVGVLPSVRRSVAQHLSGDTPNREFALAAVIELVARSAIRPGNESYAKLHGTRGATTLLKSNVVVEGDTITLKFTGKGSKKIHKEVNAARLASAISVLLELPGKRLFQYRDDAGGMHGVTSAQVNLFLREIAGVKTSLKDFRTLLASAAVLESLSRLSPAKSASGRRRQVLEAVRLAAGELHNTPTICRKSYVHETIVTAFEDGILERFADTLKGCRSQAKREQVLAQVIATAG